MFERGSIYFFIIKFYQFIKLFLFYSSSIWKSNYLSDHFVKIYILRYIYIYIIRSRSPMKINGFNNEHDSQLQLVSLTNCTKELFSFCFLFSCLSLFFIRVEILVQNRRIIWLKNRTKQLSSWTALHILLYFD